MRRVLGMMVVAFVGVWGGVVAYRMSTEAITVLATGLVVVSGVLVAGVLLVAGQRRTERTRMEQAERARSERWGAQGAAPPVVVINPGMPGGAGLPGWGPGAGGYLPAPPAPAWPEAQRQFTVIGDE